MQCKAKKGQVELFLRSHYIFSCPKYKLPMGIVGVMSHRIIVVASTQQTLSPHNMFSSIDAVEDVNSFSES